VRLFVIRQEHPELEAGRAAAHFIRIRSDVLTGVALVIVATVVGLGAL
jgi:hypothetical protein